MYIYIYIYIYIYKLNVNMIGIGYKIKAWLMYFEGVAICLSYGHTIYQCSDISLFYFVYNHIQNVHVLI